MEPKAKDIFAFGYDIEEDEEEFYKNPKLIQHARYFINMIDKALALLGPDIELLTVILTDLGKKHAKFGVTSDLFPPMGQALISTVEEMLQGDSSPYNFNTPTKNAWNEVYAAFSYDMICGGSPKKSKSKKYDITNYRLNTTANSQKA